MNGIDNWMYSEFWAGLDHNAKQVEMKKYWHQRKSLGIPVVVEGPNGPEVEWHQENEELQEDSRGQCMICSRSMTEPPSMKFWIAVLNPEYSSGFLDKGGVLRQCPHALRKWAEEKGENKKPATTYYRKKS
jgi:hypothetical protein